MVAAVSSRLQAIHERLAQDLQQAERVGLALETTGNLSNRSERAGLYRGLLYQHSSQGLRRLNLPIILAMVIILAIGIFLRAWPSASFKGVGIDEGNYATYVEKGVKYGLSNYGRVIDEFIASQVQRSQSLIPATRIGFIWPTILLTSLGKLAPLYALRLMSHGSAILLLIATAILAYRFGGVRQMLVVTT